MPDERTGTEGLKLRRVVGPLGAWSLCIGCTVGWGSFIMPATTFLPKAGPLGTAIAFALGTLGMLVVAANYGYMAQCCPKDGGVYAYAREEFGPNQAFVCSWCLVLAYVAAMCANATAVALVARSVFGGMLQVGFHYTIAGYEVWLGEALAGIAGIVATALLCVRGTRLAAGAETFFSLGMVGGVVAITLLALASPKATLADALPAFAPDKSPVLGTLMVIAVVPWAFIGFEAVSQVSEECSFPRTRFARLMGIAIVVGTLIYLALNTVTAMFVPERYADWTAYLADLPNLAGIESTPTFHASYRLAGRAGVLLFGFTALCAVLSGVVGFYAAATRLLYTMATDGAVSRRFMQLHPTYHTPATVTLAIMVITLVVPFFGRNVLNWVVDLMSLGALIAYLYTSLAAMRQANRRNNRLMHTLGLTGVAVSCICIALLLVPIPQLGTSLGKESYVILFAWVALGVNFFTPTVLR